MPASRPSVPDRKRLDSDVRAFMRQPSTPWITFDRDSRVAQGETGLPLVLPVARTSILPEAGVFPNDVAGAASAPASEPSNLVVAADVAVADAPSPPAADAPGALDALGIPMQRLPWLGRRAVRAGVACAAVALAVVASLAGVASRDAAVAGAARSLAGAAGAGGAAGAVAGAGVVAAAQPSVPVLADVPPPDLSLATPPPTTTAKPPATTSPPRFPPNDPRAKLGRLAIRGAASYDMIFFDGKRLLGRGPRAFDVMCGAHTVAVGKRSDAQPASVPCMGEYVVGN